MRKELGRYLALFKQVYFVYCRVNYNVYRIVAGTHNLSDAGTIYTFEEVIRHPYYGRPQFSNDVALIKVDTPIAFTERVKPIELNPHGVGVETVLASKCSRHFLSG